MRRIRLIGLLVLVCALSGCGWFGGGSSAEGSESVFSIKPGECFVAPPEVQAQLSKLDQVKCSAPHTQEAYALVRYSRSKTDEDSGYPGSDQLSSFAKGACAQRFTRYVGVDYLDSSLYFTYLMPSARSWEQDRDRTVICFVTSTGGRFTQSVKGSKR